MLPQVFHMVQNDTLCIVFFHSRVMIFLFYILDNSEIIIFKE